MPYLLRAVPWWTDEATRFLANLFKWYPSFLQRNLTVLEVGSGNSTFFLLSKGASVVSIETDDGYIEYVKDVAERAGYRCRTTTELVSTDPDYDLTLVKPPGYHGKSDKAGASYESLDIEHAQLDFDILINDGIDRMHFLSKFRSCPESIVVLDNCEYAANWGRLAQSSAKPDVLAVYRAFLRDPDWDRVIFEQPEGREGRGLADVTGWESPHRWATAVSWRKVHALGQLMVSTLGLPLVNPQGLDNVDLKTLEQRCPFDWDTMQWPERGLHPQDCFGSFFPPALDLGLDRGYG